VDESGKKKKKRRERFLLLRPEQLPPLVPVNGETIAPLVLRSVSLCRQPLRGGKRGSFGSYAQYDDPWTNGRGEEGKRRAGPGLERPRIAFLAALGRLVGQGGEAGIIDVFRACRRSHPLVASAFPFGRLGTIP
jgi:hypothetical protein